VVMRARLRSGVVWLPFIVPVETGDGQLFFSAFFRVWQNILATLRLYL
jgi:hypothetical protein